MGPRRKSASAVSDDSSIPTTITVIPPKAVAPVASNLPSALRFPLYVVLSFSISAISKTLSYELNGPMLEPISRDGDTQMRLILTALWKILELGVGWLSNFDALDMFYFSILSHVPHALLLNTFYLVPLPTLALLLTTTCLSNALPLRLLRRKLPHNLPTLQTHEQLTSDLSIQFLTSLLATLCYTLPVLLSYATWLPSHLAIHFTGLATLSPAHTATLPTILPILLPLGFASLKYTFDPAAHALSSAAPTIYTVPLAFDPATASLSQTLHRNILWHLYLPARTQEALRRTATLMAWTFANTAFWACTEIAGAEVWGGLGWALVWGVGTAAQGLALSWVAGVLQ